MIRSAITLIASGMLCLLIIPNILIGQPNLQRNSNAVPKDKFGATPRKYADYDNAPAAKAGNEWFSIGPYGGDVHTVAVNPVNTETVFAAAGIPFVSFDGGANWQVLEELYNLSDNKITEFASRTDGVIFASGSASYAKGFRSDDGGNSWQQFFIPLNRGIHDVAVDPGDNDVIYLGLTSDPAASTNKAMMKSTDGGVSWTPLDLISALPPGFGVVDIAVTSDTLFVIGNYSFSDALIAASFDGGTTWVDRTANLPTGKPYNAIAIAGQKVYMAGGQLFGGQNLGVYETSDWGSSWINISGTFPNKVSNDILIDPADSDRILVGTEGDGIYISEDGGATWNFNATGAGTSGSARSVCLSMPGSQTVYAGFLSLAVCKSADGGDSWDYANKGIATLLINDIEIDPANPDVILAGFEAENSGGCYLSDDGGETWSLADGLPATRFSAVTIGENGNMFAWSNGPSSVAQEGLYKSTDGGQTWDNTGPNIGSLFETQIFSLDISPADPDLLFIGGNNFGVNGWDAIIYRTTDAGAAWTEVYKGPENNSVRFIHIIPDGAGQSVLAAYKSENSQGGFLKSADGGAGWEEINNGLPAANKWAASIVSDPSDTEVYYGGIGGYGGVNGAVYTSLDGGMNWLPLNLTLGTYSKVKDLFINPLNNSVIYAATSIDGVQFSEDKGQNWEPANEGLPATHITSFSRSFFLNDTLQLIAGTYTNSAFQTSIYDPGTSVFHPVAGDQAEILVYPNPAFGDIRVRVWTAGLSDVSLELYDIHAQRIFSEILIADDSGNALLNIHRDDLPSAGIYFLRIIMDGKHLTKKILVR